MDQANTLDADAIVHAGDIFDHVAIGADRSFVIDALNSELNIPFYYIYGNHDEPASRRTVDGATNDTSEIERLLKKWRISRGNRRYAIRNRLQSR